MTRIGRYSGAVKVQYELVIAQIGSGIPANFGAKNVPREIGVTRSEVAAKAENALASRG